MSINKIWLFMVLFEQKMNMKNLFLTLLTQSLPRSKLNSDTATRVR